MLCFRCNHRAKHLETKKEWQPRYECGQIEHAVNGCYMYQAVKPVTLIKAYKDDRSELAPAMFAARSKVAKTEIEMECVYKKVGRRHVRYWRPKE